MTEKIVLTLTKHLLWGNVLQPVLVQENEYGTLEILEFADSKSSVFSQLNEATQQIVLLSGEMSDANLMVRFSKEKSVASFHNKMKPETIASTIRPFVEDCQHKMAILLASAQLPFYIRREITCRNLYKSDLIALPAKTPEVIYQFRKDEEKACIHYSIQVQSDDMSVDLYRKKPLILSSSPATLLINDRLLAFENIDLKKLMPFLTKEEIKVPISYEKTYIRTFISSCLENGEVIAEGFDIQEIKPQKKAVLAINIDADSKPMLSLALQYDGMEIEPGSLSRNVVTLVEQDEKTSLKWFSHDKNWEESVVGLLLESGLEQVGPNLFTHQKNLSERVLVKQVKNMEEWISRNSDLLKKFEFNQELLD